ncbi:hypothetical protein T459_19144 [Capsicum annuum]|uniref:Uncharacterized protein n=1 Tax=Capsicum annuum TaxID=4072 RepID=A0A2G2Z0T4_CAPAN|nr:hypothetical protein T459_19144 [Capsicum annuum]
MDKVDESEDEWSMCKEKPSLSKDAENRTSVRRATGSFKRYRDYYVDEWEDDTDDYEVFPLCYGHHIPSNTRSRGADVSPESKPKNSPKDVIKISGKLSACSSLPSWAPAKLNGEQCLGMSSKKKSPRANSTMDKVDNSEDEWNVCNEKSRKSCKAVYKYSDRGCYYMHSGEPLPESFHNMEIPQDQNKPISWVANCDGYIICTPVEMGGCGKYILELKHLLPRNWISTLKQKQKGF